MWLPNSARTQSQLKLIRLWKWRGDQRAVILNQTHSRNRPHHGDIRPSAPANKTLNLTAYRTPIPPTTILTPRLWTAFPTTTTATPSGGRPSRTCAASSTRAPAPRRSRRPSRRSPARRSPRWPATPPPWLPSPRCPSPRGTARRAPWSEDARPRKRNLWSTGPRACQGSRPRGRHPLRRVLTRWVAFLDACMLCGALGLIILPNILLGRAAIGETSTWWPKQVKGYVALPPIHVWIMTRKTKRGTENGWEFPRNAILVSFLMRIRNIFVFHSAV